MDTFGLYGSPLQYSTMYTVQLNVQNTVQCTQYSTMCSTQYSVCSTAKYTQKNTVYTVQHNAHNAVQGTQYNTMRGRQRERVYISDKALQLQPNCKAMTLGIYNLILDIRISVLCHALSLTLREPLLDSETGWTGAFQSKNNLLNLSP